MVLDNPVFVERTRRAMVENRHRGAIVVSDARGQVVAATGDADWVVFPRSAYKILQALPLIESGAADAFGLNAEHLALACASHNGGLGHTSRVGAWLHDLGLCDKDLCCGAPRIEDVREADARDALTAAGAAPQRMHYNCSGKHAGFLTLAAHIKAPKADYVNPDHAVQRAVRAALEETSEAEGALDYGIDGCAAPNFAMPLRSLAHAMAKLAAPETALSGKRREAAIRLREAMRAHPLLVSGEGRACAGFAEATGGRAVCKTGADGVFTAIIPETGWGLALKIEDGATEAAECAMAEALVALGLAEAAHPEIARRLDRPIRNSNGEQVGAWRASGAVSRSLSQTA